MWVAFLGLGLGVGIGVWVLLCDVSLWAVVACVCAVGDRCSLTGVRELSSLTRHSPVGVCRVLVLSPSPLTPLPRYIACATISGGDSCNGFWWWCG